MSSTTKVVFDLTQNEKQNTFFEEGLKAAAGVTDYRYLFYGGGIRGGKTSVSLTLLYVLARKYPGSRWLIIRESFPSLEKTTIPSFEKFYPESSAHIKRYYRNRSNFHVRFNNGSIIYFISENLKQDSNLDWMLGLEVNGILLEQCEELSAKVWARSIERAGSWYIEPMPAPIILGTMNPCQNWVKEMVYEPYREKRLSPPYYFLPALPSDSPFVTAEQWNAWENMDAIAYKQYVGGDWDAFKSVKAWAHAFNEHRHTRHIIELNREDFAYLSFDFNHNPVTATIYQHDPGEIRAVKEFESNVGLRDLCVKHILPFIGDTQIMITGDRSGYDKSPLTEGNIVAYDIIKSSLNLTDYQNKAPRSNPYHFKSRELVNGLFDNFPSFVISRTGCPKLIKDLKFIDGDADHRIIKSNQKEELGAHFLDGLRYYCNTFHSDFIKYIFG